jgi:hypothetical protein
MKKFIIIYTFISLALLGIVYLLTLFIETQNRLLAVFNEKAEAVLAEGNVTDFLKFQSLAFKELHVEQTDHYTFYVYQILARFEEEYINQFSVIVVPKTALNYARTSDDPSDLTSIYLYDLDSDTVIFDSLEEQETFDYAVSYGIVRMGFYYYAVPLDQDYEMSVTLFDYDKQNIYHGTVTFTYTEYQGVETLPEGFISGYSVSEIEDILNMQEALRKPLRNNLIIFFVLDLALGTSIYYMLKMKQRKKTELI